MNDEERRRRLGEEIASLMGPLVREMRLRFRACAEEAGLAVGDAQALFLLERAGDLTTKDLAARLAIDPANASSLLTRLERRGLLRREPAEHDRRRRSITLTGEGHEQRERLARCIAAGEPAFGRLSTDELEAFRDLLRRVAGHGRGRA
jgi:DNA-binding MarR family transcriptional regulator